MLIIEHLYKSFGKVVAVEDVSLCVGTGETVVLMGPSGCGKSTTIRTVNRLVRPDKGKISFDGAVITEMKEEELSAARKSIGFVFQQFNLINRLTVLENTMLALITSGIPFEIAKSQAIEALIKVGMRNHSGQRPAELSGGQQQRVGIARALALQPKLMLWDEPTASLDPILVREVLVIMEELAKYHASAMLVVTHELPFALHAADKVILMDKGRIVETGDPAQIFVKPQSTVGCKYKDLIEYQLNAGKMTLSGKRIA